MTRQEFEDALRMELTLRGQPFERGAVEWFVQVNWPQVNDNRDVTYWADQYQKVATQARV